VSDELRETVKPCYYCGELADGPMLAVGVHLLHANCVINRLNELLDPDWDGHGEPRKIVVQLDPALRNPCRHWTPEKPRIEPIGLGQGDAKTVC